MARLREDIEAGVYPVGAGLPYARDLAAAHDVSVGTVSRAIAELENRGLIDAGQDRRARVISKTGALVSVADRTVRPPHGAPAKVPPAGFEPAAHGLGNHCSIP